MSDFAEQFYGGEFPRPDRPVKTGKGAMLSKMISLATERHAGQFDKGGRLKGVTERDIARMVRYHEFYLELEAL